MPVPDPDESRVLLVGTASYRDKGFRALAGVGNNLTDLRRAVTDRSIWGLPPANVRVVLDPRQPTKITGPLRQAAREATDTLLFYYAGHGFLGPKDSALYLTCRDSFADDDASALEYKYIRNAMLDSRALRKIVILDCCFSGNAHTQMGTEADLQSIAGAYVLTSAERNRASTAPPELRNTAFTHALLTLLNRGVDRWPGQRFLTLDQIYRELHVGLPSESYPKPERRDHGNLGDLPLVCNRAYQPPARPVAEPSPVAAVDDDPAVTGEAAPARVTVVNRIKQAGVRLWRPVPALASALLGVVGGSVVAAVANGTVSVLAGATGALLCYVTTLVAEGPDDDSPAAPPIKSY